MSCIIQYLDELIVAIDLNKTQIEINKVCDKLNAINKKYMNDVYYNIWVICKKPIRDEFGRYYWTDSIWFKCCPDIWLAGWICSQWYLHAVGMGIVSGPLSIFRTA